MDRASESDSRWTALDDGLTFRRPTGETLRARQRLGLFVQLEDEGLAEANESGWTLSWSSVHSLFRLSAYVDSLPLLALPPLVGASPVLGSYGSLTDHDFVISIEGWEDASGQRVNIRRHRGAIVSVGGEFALLSEPAWTLTDRVVRFLQRPPEQRDDLSQRREWGI